MSNNDAEFVALLREADSLVGELNLKLNLACTVCILGHAKIVLHNAEVCFSACAMTYEDALRRLICTLTLEKHAARRAPGGCC